MATRARILIAFGSTITVLALAACATQAGARSAVSTDDLVGVWVMDETFTGPEQPYISFTDDGKWTSSDGCNTVAGTWTLGDLGAITTTSGPSTEIACDGAPLPLVMTDAEFVQVDGDLLTITGSSEPATTDLVRSTDPLVGPQGPPSGTWTDASDESVYLEFVDDGSFSGSDGCNQVFGSWSVADDGAIEFSEMGTTLMACTGGPEPWLGGAARAYQQAGVMTIQDKDGLVLGQLTQQ